MIDPQSFALASKLMLFIIAVQSVCTVTALFMKRPMLSLVSLSISTGTAAACAAYPYAGASTACILGIVIGATTLYLNRLIFRTS